MLLIKKVASYFGIIGVLLFWPFLSFALSITPDPVTDPSYPSGTTLTIVCGGGGIYVYSFKPDGSNDGVAGCTDYSNNHPYEWAYNWTGNWVGTGHLVETTGAGCNGLDYSNCIINADYVTDIEFCLVSGCPSPPAPPEQATGATTTAILGSIAFGNAIIIALMSVAFIAYIYNSMTPKKKKWQ